MFAAARPMTDYGESRRSSKKFERALEHATGRYAGGKRGSRR